MVFGVGVDILFQGTVPDRVLQPGDPFFRATYTEKEIAEGKSRSCPGDYFRSRFAGKEAVFKALRCHPDQLRRWAEIEILGDANGVPQVTLSDGMLKAAAHRRIVKFDLSISCDGDYTVAFCVASAADTESDRTGADGHERFF